MIPLVLTGCLFKKDAVLSTAVVCPTVTGTAWVPNVAGIGNANHDDASIASYKDVYTVSSAPLLGLGQSYGPAQVVTISNIDMETDLGSNGSISLIAETTGFPASLSGSAWPVLVSLSDGTNEWVQMSGCTAAGFFDCSLIDSGGNPYCGARVGCGPDPAGTLGSVYLGTDGASRRARWEQQNSIGSSDYVTSNIFPNCNWSSAVGGQASCPFAMAPGNFFTGGKIRSGTGIRYTAKYILLTSNYESVTGYTAGVKLTVVRKKDANASGTSKGAVDLNVVLVGSTNIQDSHTDKGKQNLDALMEHVVSQYGTENATTTNIKIGKITVYEWACADGGDSWATTDVDAIGTLFKTGSGLVDQTSEGKALNIFLVSTIDYSGAGTILGISGGIASAAINGTGLSGLAFSSFNKLDTFNPSCSGTGICPVSSQENSFVNMGGTIVHETGHFLGLNHLSEAKGTTHDRTPDTPQCTTQNMLTQCDPGSASPYCISRATCKGEAQCSTLCSGTYCATQTACQFNHVMWWTTKSYSSGVGDGNLFSAQSADIINYNPYVR